ncbi:hypothetical protein ACQ4LE_002839 [Meloidogyne hapla]|uniref:Sm domain-containing protein n=1 Tax=Meloidogyne hapla TaxID=6305 RepID=A0A1I8BXG3_MELHA
MVDTSSSNSEIDQEESATIFPSLPDSKFVTNKERQMYKWVDKVLRIELTDGRVYQGVLLCVDNQSNIILGNSREFWIKSVNKDKIQQKPPQIQENLESSKIGLESTETSSKTKKQKKKNKKVGKQKDVEVETNFKGRKELSPMRKVGMAMIARKYIKHIYLVKSPILPLP